MQVGRSPQRPQPQWQGQFPLHIQMPAPKPPAGIMGPFGDPQQPQQVVPDPMPIPEPPTQSVLRPEDRIRQIKHQQPRW
jgi:hypothetical protein